MTIKVIAGHYMAEFDRFAYNRNHQENALLN